MDTNICYFALLRQPNLFGDKSLLVFPHDQTTQWPIDQLDLKPKKNFNMPLGDSSAPGEMTDNFELPDKVFSPETLPIMEDIDLIDLWRIILHLTQFSGQHDPSIDSATNLSKNPSLFGRQSMPHSQSSTACDKRETTLTIRARFTSKETQMVSTSNQVRFLSLKLRAPKMNFVNALVLGHMNKQVKLWCTRSQKT